uniref:Uncharacterized protein n=1 Tax=Rhipicephalus zambeziensis TaxID=60191 RepID=A0A224YLJ8_9ACAR
MLWFSIHANKFVKRQHRRTGVGLSIIFRIWPIVLPVYPAKRSYSCLQSSAEKSRTAYPYQGHGVIKFTKVCMLNHQRVYAYFLFFFRLYYPVHQSRHRFIVTSSLAKPRPHGARH